MNRSQLLRRILVSRVETVFSPLELFSGGELGIWLDPSDLSTMFQDSAGTTPVTADGDPVGLIQDKSGNGNDASQSSTGLRPLYKTDGALHWLQFDGLGSHLIVEGSTTTLNFLHNGLGGCTITGVNLPSDSTGGMVLSSNITNTQIGFSIYIFNSYWRSVVSNGTGVFLIVGNTGNVAVGAQVLTTIHDSSRASDYQVLKNQNSEFTLNHNGDASLSNATNNMRIGRRGDSAGVNLNGNIYSMIIVEGVPSKLNEAENYTANKTGVTL